MQTVSSRVEQSIEENRLMVDEEARVSEIWLMLPVGHIQAAPSLRVSPPTFDLFLSRTTNNPCDGDQACRRWSKRADRWMLPGGFKAAVQ